MQTFLERVLYQSQTGCQHPSRMSQTNYWDEIEEAFNDVDIYESFEVFSQGAARYPEWKIDLLAVHWTMSEIVNGGLAQYFANHTAVLAPEAVMGFQRIGRADLAEALGKAMSLLGNPYPRESEPRNERLALLTGQEPSASEKFSLIPNWVAEKTGLATKATTPFQEWDKLFTSAADAVEQAMDAYAVVKAG